MKHSDENLLFERWELMGLSPLPFPAETPVGKDRDAELRDDSKGRDADDHD